MTVVQHLRLRSITLAPAAEWVLPSGGWRLIRLREGVAYCRNGFATRPWSPGEVLLWPPRLNCQILASRLGLVRLDCFSVDCDGLMGLITLTERKLVERAASSLNQGPRSFSPDHALARRLGELLDAGHRSDLQLRAQLLEVFALALEAELGSRPAATTLSINVRARLRQLSQQLPESQLFMTDPDEVARQLRCSRRHLSRLFREEFGTSFRARQTEFRLLKAGELLATSDAKVIDVALESGYRHLGLFNVMFKRRFHMTPSQWRRRHRQPRKVSLRLLRVARVLLPLVWLGLSLLAAEGTAVKPPTFEVKGFQVEGNTLLPQSAIDAALAGHTGAAVGLEQIREALGALQLAYRTRGYVTAAVSLPQQQLTNGIVRVVVTEGRLAEINVVHNRHFSTDNVRRALPSLRTNLVLNSKLFQVELDRANANPDRQIYPEIQPGPTPGTSALQLKVNDRLPLHVKLDINNLSTPGTPELRTDASAQYNNLWQREHSFGFQYGFTPERLQVADKLPWAFYDQPLIAFYNAYYRLPLSAPEALADRVADGGGNFGYDEATRQFRLPPPTGQSELNLYASRFSSDTGVKLGPRTQVAPPPTAIYSQDSGEDLTINESVGIRWSKPLPPVAGIHSSLSAGLDYKHYALSSFNTNGFFQVSTVPPLNPGDLPTIIEVPVYSPQPPRHLSVDYLPISLHWDGSRPDRWGVTTLGVGWSANFAPLSQAAHFQQVAGSTNVTGRYLVASAALGRTQRIYGDWSVVVRADAQWANEPLITNEQFGIGGMGGPRGYREGEVYGDTGWRVMIEPHTPMFTYGMIDQKTMILRVRGLAFMDYARDYLLEPQGRPAPPPLWGTGFGVTGTVGQTFEFRGVMGWALARGTETRAGTLRVSFWFGMQF